MCRWCGAPYPICIKVGNGAPEAAEADPKPTAAAAACISAADPQTSTSAELNAYSGLTPTMESILITICVGGLWTNNYWPWWKWCPADPAWWLNPTSSKDGIPPTWSWSWCPPEPSWWWPPTSAPPPLPPPLIGLPSLTSTGTATRRGELCEV